MRFVASAVACLLAWAPAFGSTDAGSSPAQQGLPAEVIYYSSVRPPNWDLYWFEQPGSPPRRLTTDPFLSYNPAISPDGRWLVFTSERHGNPDLYLLDLDGNPGEPQPLLQGPAMYDAPAFSPDGLTLAFVSTRDGAPDIFIASFEPGPPARVGEPVNLTRSAAGDFNPTFSPDGTRILFSSSRDAADESGSGLGSSRYNAGEIHVMRTDGSDVRRLTENASWDGSPAWSPDGEWIFFYSQRDGQARIYRMRTDGSDVQPVSEPGEASLSPAVGAEDRVVFSLRLNGRWSIVSTRFDGSDLRLESDTERDYWAPAVDPVSGTIFAHGPGPLDDETFFQADVPGAFALHEPLFVELPDRTVSLHGVRGYLPALNLRDGEIATSEAFSRLLVTNLDGAERRTVFDEADGERYRGTRSAWWPSWSRDGEWIAFSVGMPFSPAATNVNVWRARRDGSEAVNLTGGSPANDALPDISPDGSRIVFRSGRDGTMQLYLMEADGSNARRLTHSEGTDTMPAFSSSGDRIAFTSNRDGDFDIYIVDIDEEGNAGRLERLTESPGRDMHPKFSPDDRWVLFTSERAGLSDELPLLQVIFQPQPYGTLYAIRLEDRLLVRLTHNKWEDGPSIWAAR